MRALLCRNWREFKHRRIEEIPAPAL